VDEYILLDWQYRQEQTESKLLGHSHVTHKPHKTTGGRGGHERAQAQATAWAQPLANAVTPNAHAPQTHQQMHQHQLYLSYLLCFQIHFKITTCYTSITKI